MDSASELRHWVEVQFAEQNRKDPGHDLTHSDRVAHWTIQLGGNTFPPSHAHAAALLHDLINPPKTSLELRSRASELSAARARQILPEFGFDAAAIEDIAAAIRTHSFSRGEEPISELGRALQDADRLEALGAIGLYRVISTGVLLGGELFDEDDPWAVHRPLDDARFSVDHFFLKLLKLPATMKTSAGRTEAERRAQFLVQFLKQLGDEIGKPPTHLA